MVLVLFPGSGALHSPALRAGASVPWGSARVIPVLFGTLFDTLDLMFEVMVLLCIKVRDNS